MFLVMYVKLTFAISERGLKMQEETKKYSEENPENMFYEDEIYKIVSDFARNGGV